MNYADPGDQVVPTTWRDPAQQSLFGEIMPRARNTDPETSKQAAASMVGGARTQRALIVAHLRKHGPMTGDGLDAALGWPNASANRRLSELKKSGAVEMLAETRATRSGRGAHLWRVT